SKDFGVHLSEKGDKDRALIGQQLGKLHSLMKPLDRRSFLKNSLLGATAVSLAGPQPSAAQTATGSAPVATPLAASGIIDTNVNLFNWPFRALKYRDTKA